MIVMRIAAGSVVAKMAVVAGVVEPSEVVVGEAVLKHPVHSSKRVIATRIHAIFTTILT